MKINQIRIQNYMGIEELKIDFKDGVNLIIGNNGAGKTSLLNALSFLVSTCFYSVGGFLGGNLRDNVRVKMTSMGDTVSNLVPCFPVSIGGNIELSGHEYDLTFQSKSMADVECADNYVMPEKFRDIFSGELAAPLLCFVRAGKNSITGNSGNNVREFNKVLRSDAYKNCLSATERYEDIQKWCLQMDYAEYQQHKEVKEYRAFKDIVSKFMSVIDTGDEQPRIYYSSLEGSLIYFNGSDSIPFDRLSAGYQSLLCLITDLAYRAVILNPFLGNIAEETDGVVLIDEIDIHLHPIWQWRVLVALRETFPKVQFIIATHSPIILSSAKDASVFLLSSPNEVSEIENSYGYSVKDVLSLSQNTLDVPAEISEYYDKVEEVLNNGTKEELDDLIKDAEQRLGQYPEILKALLDYIKINMWLGEDD